MLQVMVGRFLLFCEMPGEMEAREVRVLRYDKTMELICQEPAPVSTVDSLFLYT